MAGIVTDVCATCVELESFNVSVTFAAVAFGLASATPVDVVAPFWANTDIEFSGNDAGTPTSEIELPEPSNKPKMAMPVRFWSDCAKAQPTVNGPPPCVCTSATPRAGTTIGVWLC